MVSEQLMDVTSVSDCQQMSTVSNIDNIEHCGSVSDISETDPGTHCQPLSNVSNHVNESQQSLPIVNNQDCVSETLAKASSQVDDNVMPQWTRFVLY